MKATTALTISTLIASASFLHAQPATRETQKTLTPNSVLAELEKERKIRIVSGVCSLQTGKVTMLP
jgi:hypothetical protein